MKVEETSPEVNKLLKGKYIWEAFQEAETTLRTYSLKWEPPKSGQSKDQVLRHIRKTLYMKDVLRRAKNRIVANATKKMKNKEFEPS